MGGIETHRSMDTVLERLLDEAIEVRASDIHIEESSPSYMRLKGVLVEQSRLIVTKEVFHKIATSCGRDHQSWYELGSFDGVFTYKDTRVRVHLYRCDGRSCGTLRILYDSFGSIEGESDYEVLQQICHMTEGLVLITGPTGSGKSYTLASCLQYINSHFPKHIVTLENPVEYKLKNDRSLIHQRQLYEDIPSMGSGIRDALREDPDVIMVGEIRDRETMEAALHAAETGHLVFATMHTQRAVTAVGRIISLFPSGEQEEVRSQLSLVLKAVICQRLVHMEEQIVTIRDVLLNTPAVANLIRQKQEQQIVSVQETTRPMKTMEMAVREARAVWGATGGLEGITEGFYG